VAQKTYRSVSGTLTLSMNYMLYSKLYFETRRQKPDKNYSVADPDPGSGIGWFFDSRIRDVRKSASGSGIRDEQPGSYFLELRNHFFLLLFLGLKYLNSVMGIRDRDSSDPGRKKVGSGFRDKHPGSATLKN
jgi:hypothetical protein